MTGSISKNGNSEDRILVVDDNEAGRYAKVRVLRQAGFAVREASTGSEALRQIGDQSPDLILLDVRLPDISGLEICRMIKSNPETASITILQMSASFRDDKSKVAGLEGGADGYITEPVEPMLLVATIGAFLRTRKAEQSVREHARQWQATFDAITDGIAMVDTSGKVMRSNCALGTLLSQPAGDLVGRHLDELLPPAAGTGDIWGDLESGHRRESERTVGDRVFSLTLYPVADGRGHLNGGVCIICDITERKLMDQQLWHTQKLETIGVLAGGVAHDFNNLLMGILGNASLGLEMLSDRQATERVLRDVIRASERAADLTRQLLAYSGKGKFIVQPIDLSRIVIGTVPLLKASFPPKVTLSLNLAEDLPAIKADKTQIEQVVMNLLINAAEAIGENAGTVTVTTREHYVAEDQRQHYLSDNEVCGHYVLLEVRDDGMGMDEETTRRVFDPFFTTKFMGRGLGLSAVLGIMRAHNSAIRLRSTPGGGTTFELLFPSTAAAAEARTPQAAAGPERAVDKGRILVVDDEKIVREFFRSALQRYGYEVVVARDGGEALRIFAESTEPFAAVLLDMVMPVMTGKEVLPHLLALRPDARIVVTSGQVEEEVRRELSNWSIAGFIQKPCTTKVLVEKIGAFAAKAETGSQVSGARGRA